ncbi:MAG: hypothetical protein UT59_C0029G0012, partial [candidate division CPR2 bacterium GW2011_GWD1_39_7]
IASGGQEQEKNLLFSIFKYPLYRSPKLYYLQSITLMLKYFYIQEHMDIERIVIYENYLN